MSPVADLEIQKGGFSHWRDTRPQIFGLPRPHSVTLEVRTEYLEATVGLVKCLEINKELIRECVTMPGCCCCMPLLHNHLIDSCSYVRKNTLLAAKWGCICTPLTPPESATGHTLALEQGELQQTSLVHRLPGLIVRGRTRDSEQEKEPEGSGQLTKVSSYRALNNIHTER